MAQAPIIVYANGPIYLDPFTEIVGFSFGGPKVEIDGGILVSVYDRAVAAELDVDAPMKLKIIVTGVVLLMQLAPLFESGDWHPDTTFHLINKGHIIGIGGVGGAGSQSHIGSSGLNGGNGQSALYLNGHTIKITNAEGYIWGGGGGAGGGGGVMDAGSQYAAFGGGGGAGVPAVAGGDCDIEDQFATSPYSVVQSCANGGSNPFDFMNIPDLINQLGAAGGNGTIITPDNVIAGNGGKGGDWGEPGEPGQSASSDTLDADIGTGGLGGTAGNAIDLGGGSVTWISGNDPERVKGAIS